MLWLGVYSVVAVCFVLLNGIRGRGRLCCGGVGLRVVKLNIGLRKVLFTVIYGWDSSIVFLVLSSIFRPLP